MPTLETISIEKKADELALALIQETRLATDGPFYRKLSAALRQMAGLLPKPVKVEKVPTSVRKLFGEAFAPGVNFEFRFVISNDGKHATVAVNTNCYGHDVAFAVMLSEVLRAYIPVPYKQFSDPKIEILGGDRRSGMMSVEMSILVDMSSDDFRTTMKEAGFWEGLEYTK